MDRATRQHTTGADYEHYSTPARHSDPALTSTNSPDLDVYVASLTPQDEAQRRVRRQNDTWMVLAACGSLLLVTLVVALLITAPWRSRTAAGRHQPATREAASARGEPGQPAIGNPPAARDAVQDRGIIPRMAPGVVLIHATDAAGRGTTGNSGTGFLIDQRGYVLTNEHVIRGKDTVVARLHDSTAHVASVVAADRALDIAVLKLPGIFSTQTLSLGDSDAVRLGDAVYVLGFPLESKLGAALSVTNGLVSSIRQRQGETWFQINAAVNSGNSGGPLIHANSGTVVGVVTSKLSDAELIAFARPINSVRTFVARHLK